MTKPVSGLRWPVPLDNFLLGTFAFGNILHHAEDRPLLGISAMYQRGRHASPDYLVLLGMISFFQVVVVDRTIDQLTKPFHIGIDIFLMRDIGNMHALHFLLRIAEHTAKRMIGQHNASFPVSNGCTEGGVFEYFAKPHLADL